MPSENHALVVIKQKIHVNKKKQTNKKTVILQVTKLMTKKTNKQTNKQTNLTDPIFYGLATFCA